MSPQRLNPEEDFEDSYTLKSRQRFTGRGLSIGYDRDRAGRDVGYHLTVAPGSMELSDVRVWFQLKGLHEASISRSEIEASEYVPIDLDLDDVKKWYAAPEAVYIVLYLEATDEFIGGDIRDLVDLRFADHKGSLFSKLSELRQEKVRLRIPTKAVIDSARITEMMRHRAMRIDGPLWRGRPLGHLFDPLRSELAPLEEDLFLELVEHLLSAHDYRIDDYLDASELVVGKRGHMEALLSGGTIYATYEWPFMIGVEYGVGPDSDFREEGQLIRVQGKIALLVHPTFKDHVQPARNFRETMSKLSRRGIEKLMVIGNAPEALLMGSYPTSLLGDMYLPPQGQGALAYSVLTSPLVFMNFQDRLKWKFVNYLWDQPNREPVKLRPPR